MSNLLKRHLQMVLSLLLVWGLIACGGGPTQSLLAATAERPSVLSVTTERTSRARSSVGSTPAASIAIDSGSNNAVGSWIADTDYQASSKWSSTATVTKAINASSVPSPAPQAVYQSQRYGPHLTYTIPNLSPNTTYAVRLHFVESYWSVPGHRVFSVTINGTQVLTNFDIIKATQGMNIAIVEPFTVKADSTGAITIQMIASLDNASIAALDVNPSIPTPTPSPTQAPRNLVPARRAYDFIDYLGFNYQRSTTTPATDVDSLTVSRLLPQLLVKRLRVDLAFSSVVPTENMLVTNAGALTDCLTDNTINVAALQSFNQSLTNGCSEIELENEPNGGSNTDPNYLADLPVQAAAYRRAFPGSKIWGPSVGPDASAGASIIQAMASQSPAIASNITAWNTHAYIYKLQPEAAGSGPNVVSGCGASACGMAWSLAWYMNESKVLAPLLPGVSTEGIASYGSYPQICGTSNNVDLNTQQAYVQRGFLFGFMSGLLRAYAYKLVDDGGCSDGFGTFGIVNRIRDSNGNTLSLNPKPAFTALAYFNHLIYDYSSAASSFSPSPLSMTIDAPSDVQHVLLAQADGSYRLLLWSNAQLWNPASNVAIAPVSDSATVTFGTSASSTVYTQTAGTGMWSVAPTVSGISVPTTVSPYPQIIDIIPSGSRATPPPLSGAISAPGPTETP
jgi:hypothetical protein